MKVARQPHYYRDGNIMPRLSFGRVLVLGIGWILLVWALKFVPPMFRALRAAKLKGQNNFIAIIPSPGFWITFVPPLVLLGLLIWRNFLRRPS